MYFLLKIGVFPIENGGQLQFAQQQPSPFGWSLRLKKSVAKFDKHPGSTPENPMAWAKHWDLLDGEICFGNQVTPFEDWMMFFL